MTTTNSVFARSLVLCFLTAAFSLALLALPALESVRVALSERLNLTPAALFIVALFLQSAVFAFVYLRTQHLVSHPLTALIKQAETNRLNSAFSPKSKIMEVDRLKYLLENRVLVAEKMEEQIKNLEVRAEELEQSLSRATSERESGRLDLREKAKQIEELRLERVELQKVRADLESALEEGRKSQVRVEVEKRSDEIYAQMEKAVEATSYKSIWFPQLQRDLRAPAAIIQNTSRYLSENWDSSSFARLKSDIEILKEQSQSLIEQIDGLAQTDEKSFDDESTDPPEENTITEFLRPEEPIESTDDPNALTS